MMNCAGDLSDPVYFLQMLHVGFDFVLLFPPKMFSQSVLEKELFISVFMSELRVCVTIKAGYPNSMHFKYRLKCVLSIKKHLKNT